jgi:hypothetical protein
MKKIVTIGIFGLVMCKTTVTYCQNDSLSANDSGIVKSRIKINGLIVLTNNAFATIPAFSFDKPAILPSLNIRMGKVEYAPDFSVGLNGKPWILNNWLRYIFIDKKKWIARMGINPSLFFKKDKSISGEEIISSHRNFTGELNGKYYFSNKVNVSLTYRYNKAFDIGTLDGHSVDFTTEISRIVSIGMFSLDLRPQVFYMDSEKVFKGFFISSSISASYGAVPVFLSYQSVQSLWTNYLHEPKYLSNISLFYAF